MLWVKRSFVHLFCCCCLPGPPCPLLPLPGNNRYKLASVDVPDMVSYPLPQSSASYTGHAPSSVAMVSGLHPSKMNCTRIFNLFCLYGNIEKVRLWVNSSINDRGIADACCVSLRKQKFSTYTCRHLLFMYDFFFDQHGTFAESWWLSCC